MFRAPTSVKAKVSDIHAVLVNMEVRKRWETILFDMTSFDTTADMSYQKVYYVYRSPFGVTDRDFLQFQKVWFDFPEKDMMTVFFKSIVDERFPEMKHRVRATCFIMALVCQPGKDEQGNDISNCMLVTNIDINGLVPKWIVNIAARSSPAQWFVDC